MSYSTSSEQSHIEVYGAREHNLKNIDVKIPRNQLTVITGVSGSGKSSLAFDTIYAEGQRRYMESFSAYVRTFLGGLERPDVDKIEGLSSVISIEQKTTSKNPRSTVGTSTEIYDFLRLLFARAGIAYSYVTGKPMIKQTEEQIVEQILKQFDGSKLILLAPVVKGRKGHYRELFVQIRKQGFTKVRVDGETVDITPKMQIDRYKTHNIEIVIDRLKVDLQDRFRVAESVKLAMKQGNGVIMLEDEAGELHYFSKYLMDPESGISYDEPAPNVFSFNSPYGACPSCNGLGVIEEFTEDSIIPDESMSITQGAIAPIGEYRNIWFFKELEKLFEFSEASLSTPFKELPEETKQVILQGGEFKYSKKTTSGKKIIMLGDFEGVIPFLEKSRLNNSERGEQWARDFMKSKVCPECEGQRLKIESRHFRISDKNISELAQMNINQLGEWFEGIEEKLNDKQKIIANEILKEIRKRIVFLQDVGLTYLTLDRSLKTLSGGESQRIRLATQIGTQLVGVTYILDEPSIGLHQRDNEKLINALKALRDLGNTVIVVEHDKDMMLEADYVIDIGPKAGIHGGKVVAQGTPKEFLQQGSTTAGYLSGSLSIEMPKERRKGNGTFLELKGAKGNNLRNVDLKLPLGTFICVTGVSGSGKSTLIHNTLHPVLSQYIYRSKKDPLEYDSIDGLEHIDKVIEVDQSPIGRTPRSNPATYTSVFTDIRSLFAELPESKIRGYKPGRFSFNVKGGRCETCEGAGLKLIEMDFLPSIHVECETCKGKRYNRETLEVRFKGKSISDVLEMTVEQAVEFFENQPQILRKIKTLKDVGLGYITLGQHATTLSGGEAQRVKLATELSKKDTGKTFYILDEPTTGLHFSDIQYLITVLNNLVEKGNTVLVIEHNMDIIKVSDYIIDIGLEGGNAGGDVIAEGSPEEIIKQNVGYTAQFLKPELQ